MHALRHCASSQCLQVTGIRTVSPASTNSRFMGEGLSDSAEKSVFPFECWTAQAISQLLHPVHRSGLTNS